MVARKFLVRHNDSQFDLDYDTEDGLEVLKFQLFSLTSVLPDEQKIIGGENLIITEDTDLNSVADNLRLISIQDGDQQESSVIRIEAKDEQVNSSIPVERLEDEVAIECSIPIGDPTSVAQSQSDEELARMLQAEEEALYLQQFHARSDSRHEFEQRIRPYISQVLLYEDPVRQEAARKTVPVEELEEKALVSLAKAWEDIRNTVRECQVFIANLLSSLHPRDVYYASLREYDQQGGCYLTDFIDIFKFLNSITYNIGNFFPIFGDESNDDDTLNSVIDGSLSYLPYADPIWKAYEQQSLLYIYRSAIVMLNFLNTCIQDRYCSMNSYVADMQERFVEE